MSKESIEDLTRRMVEIPSVTGRREESLAVLDLVDEFLGDVDSKTFEKNGVVSRLWGDLEAIMNPKLLLSGHVDVVDAPERLFCPVIEDGRMFGRGAGDMKGFVASMVASYTDWITKMNGAHGVGLLLTSDEEVGGFNGTRYVIDEGLKAGVVFIPDGSFDYDIVQSQKAPHHFHVRAKGTGGHASRAFEIDNPVNRIWKLYGKMRGKYAKASLDDSWKTTFEMTVVNTDKESSANAIPSEVEAWFSWRWPLEQISFNQGVEDMKRFSKDFGVDILDDGHGMGEGCITDPSAEYVQIWKGVIEKKLGKKVGFQNMHGATDGRHFYMNGSEQVLATSGLTGAHHSGKNAEVDEWVDLESLGVLSSAISEYVKILINK
jgi:succinyl-diaminopimelate desuccinylase